MVACAAPFHLLDLWPILGAAAGAVVLYAPKVLRHMQKIFQVLSALVLLATLSGCANAWKTSYVGGAVAADFVVDTHKQAWSEPLNARAEECDATLDPETDTKADFDECMGVYASEHNSKVVRALEVYDASASVLAQLLLTTDPENPDEKKLLSAWGNVLNAALDLVSLFPEGEKYARQLRTLTKGI